MFNDLLDESKSLDAIPYWLLPFRPRYLPYFQFKLTGEGEFRGRPVYIIVFTPAHKRAPKLSPDDPYRDAAPWQGTLWIDVQEFQLAHVEALRQTATHGIFPHAAFTIDYERVAESVWFPSGGCNVLWGGVNGKVSFANTNFRKPDVFSQIEYVTSTVR